MAHKWFKLQLSYARDGSLDGWGKFFPYLSDLRASESRRDGDG